MIAESTFRVSHDYRYNSDIYHCPFLLSGNNLEITFPVL